MRKGAFSLGRRRLLPPLEESCEESFEALLALPSAQHGEDAAGQRNQLVGLLVGDGFAALRINFWSSRVVPESYYPPPASPRK